MAEMTVFGGALVRRGKDDWAWRDGTPEPRVEDLSPDVWNFRCRTYGSGECCVEVPRGLALETHALAWVLEGARAGRYARGLSGDHTGPRRIRAGGSVGRAHIRPGEDPLHGHEPLAEVPGPIPAVILVPVADWDAWVEAHPTGAAWDRSDEPALLERARALGWQPVDE